MKRNLLVIMALILLVSFGCAPGSAPTVTVTQTVAPTPVPAPLSAETTTLTPSPTPTPNMTTTTVTTPAPITTTSPTLLPPTTTPTPPAPPTPIPSPTASPTAAIKFEDKYIDVHTHILTSKMPLDQIIQNMDSEGIDKMIIMETPSAIYYGRHKDYGIPDAAEKYPDRFLCLYSGDAITMLDKFASKTYTKTDEDKYIALLEAAMKTGKYAGFGEVALRHGPVAPQASLDEPAFADVTVPGDHPWVLILSDIAAEYDVPIDIHMEATDQTIPGLEKLLEHNINTKIIWSHAGWELVMNGKASPGLFRQLMENHPNLYTSIKIGYDTTEVSFLDKKGLITSEWMALLKDYPDRFMIGSDIKPGLRQNEFAIISGVRAMLKQLPASVFKKIERENAIEIFKIK